MLSTVLPEVPAPVGEGVMAVPAMSSPSGHSWLTQACASPIHRTGCDVHPAFRHSLPFRSALGVNPFASFSPSILGFSFGFYALLFMFSSGFSSLVRSIPFRIFFKPFRIHLITNIFLSSYIRDDLRLTSMQLPHPLKNAPTNRAAQSSG